MHFLFNTCGVILVIQVQQVREEKASTHSNGMHVVPSPSFHRACLGDPGNNGTDGSRGDDGRDGVPGDDGRDGVPGDDGTDGVPGDDGTDGVPGVDGRDGSPGPKGRQLNLSIKVIH